mmetsp:Transcript_55248/g.96103  ORF Transcript_55248/g.96103 Transcript_55248/m.96103 type:complete len:168 (+) Transcript_55248:1188-1691(+)
MLNGCRGSLAFSCMVLGMLWRFCSGPADTIFCPAGRELFLLMAAAFAPAEDRAPRCIVAALAAAGDGAARFLADAFAERDFSALATTAFDRFAAADLDKAGRPAGLFDAPFIATWAAAAKEAFGCAQPPAEALRTLAPELGRETLMLRISEDLQFRRAVCCAEAKVA